MQELEIVREKLQSKYRVVKTDEDLEWNRAIDLCTNIINAHIKHMTDGWIPVEERLPEVGENVLGTNNYNEVLVYHYGWNSPHTRKMFFHLCGAAADIIAWRPLPEPYQPKSN